MRLSARIKSFFKSKGISVNVKTGVAKNPFISCSLVNWKTESFPLEYRREMLKMIYGADCSFAAEGNAGNIRPNSLAMQEKEWEKFLENK